MGLSTLGTAQYTLTVEATPAAVMPDATTYRFYVNFDDANDQISAVFGNVDFPLEVNVPEGAFNTALNSSWNASGINNSFVAVFPRIVPTTLSPPWAWQDRRQPRESRVRLTHSSRKTVISKSRRFSTQTVRPPC